MCSSIPLHAGCARFALKSQRDLLVLVVWFPEQNGAGQIALRRRQWPNRLTQRSARSSFG